MRNLKSLNNKTGRQILAKITTMTNNHEKYKNCYFWTGTGNAACRRSREFKENLTFYLNGKIYEWEQELRISCRNFYWTSSVRVDGRKSNITVMRKLLNNPQTHEQPTV